MSSRRRIPFSNLSTPAHLKRSCRQRKVNPLLTTTERDDFGDFTGTKVKAKCRPPESPFAFVLSETEVHVDVKSVFACDIDPNDRVGCSVILSQVEITRIQQQLLDFLHS